MTGAPKPVGAPEEEEARRYVRQGDRLRAAGQMAEAVASYREARVLQPKSGEVRIKLAHALKLSAAYAEAAELLGELALDYPDDPAVAKEFGRLYATQQRLDEALEQFQRVVERHPNDADAHHWLANLEHLKGNARAADAHFRRTIALDPLVRIPATKHPPDFAALLLFSPGNANTPPDTLVKSAAYDVSYLLLMPGVTYDAEALRRTADVVVNLISDVDHGAEVLPMAADLVDRIGLPTINHPREILKTDRESIANRLAGIPFCRVPVVTRFADDGTLAELGHYPALVRVAGTHGGESFGKVDEPAGLNSFVAAHRGAQFYLTEYVDCQSADGFFRKYRLFFIGDAMLPYHLAIHDRWKVHHARTDMANHLWMQEEEAAFLEDPGTALSPRHFAALQAIKQAIELDFFGIDCGISRDGQLVVFEVNASMLVHQDNGVFPYKVPAVGRIKHAFDAMLAARVSHHAIEVPLGSAPVHLFSGGSL